MLIVKKVVIIEGLKKIKFWSWVTFKRYVLHDNTNNWEVLTQCQSVNF